MAQDFPEQATVRAAFHALADFLPATTAVSALDRQFRIVEANDAFVARFLQRFGIRPVREVPLDLLLPPTREGADLLSIWRRGLSGEGVDLEFREDGPDGGCPVRLRMIPVRDGDADGGTTCLGAVMVEAPAKDRHAEAAQRKAEERARLATEMAGLGFWESDLEEGRSVWSSRCKELHGLPPDTAISKMRFWRLVHPDDRTTLWKSLSRALGPQGDGTFSAEYRVTRPREGVRWMRVQGAVRFAHSPSGARAVHMLGTSMDITEQRRSEERLRASLAEKEMLLREVHHRVKNNLQSLWSLVQIEAVRVDAPLFRSRLEAIAQRIAVLGRIHQQLYAGANLARIDVGRYLDELAADLRSAAGDPRNFVLSVSADRFGCDIDTAIPLGLIANELVSNSVRHAFPDERRGRIVLRLAGTPGGPILFEVADDGVGGTVDDGGTGIGSMLVGALADQLDATVQVTTERGRRTVLTIPARRFHPLAA